MSGPPYVINRIHYRFEYIIDIIDREVPTSEHFVFRRTIRKFHGISSTAGCRVNPFGSQSIAVSDTP